MRSKELVIAALFAVAFVGAAGAETVAQVPVEPGAVIADTVKAVEVGNRICPVMKEAIEPGNEVKFEYQGKIYNFCCPMCIKKFQAEPEKYIQELESLMKEQK